MRLQHADIGNQGKPTFTGTSDTLFPKLPSMQDALLPPCGFEGVKIGPKPSKLGDSQLSNASLTVDDESTASQLGQPHPKT